MTIDINSILQKWKTSLEMVTMWVNTKHYKDFPQKFWKHKIIIFYCGVILYIHMHIQSNATKDGGAGWIVARLPCMLFISSAYNGIKQYQFH